MNKRLVVLDWMRALAILIILFHHLPGYTFNYYNLNNFGIPLDLSILNVFNRYTGLSLFVFTSGYLLNSRRNHAYEFTDIKKFVFRRWIRIFPLYMLALGAFIVLYDISQPTSIFAHLFGLQLLVASPDLKPAPTLWFIGLILAYYSIFLVWKAKSISQYMKIFVIISFPVLVLALNVIWQITDFRLLLYYAIFWFGIYCGTSGILDRSPKLLSAASILIILLLLQLMHLTGYEAIKEPDDSLASFLTINFWMMGFVVFSYYVLRYLPDRGLTFGIVEKIAYASYCMYLFHRPVWSLVGKVIEQGVSPNNEFLFSFLLIVISLPALFILCSKIQQSYDQRVASYLGHHLRPPASSDANKISERRKR